MSARERAESGAADWIGRRERSDWGAANQAELDAWIAASTDNRVAWLRLNAAWESSRRLRSLVSTGSAYAVPKPEEVRLPFFGAEPRESPAAAVEAFAPAGSGRVSRRAVGRIAALAALAAVVFGAPVAWQSLRAPGFHTGVGALQAVPLADGSRVTLNTSTNIRVDVTPTERRVDLQRGEAFFEVAKDPTRPFVVEAGSRRIVAVGTKFSVRREGGEVRVLVTEGAVRLESAGSGPADESGGQQSDEVLLHAGSIARAEDESVLVRERPLAEVEQLLSWRSGYLVFDRTPLAEAVAEFNRYNSRQIVIDDPRVAAVPVGGQFRATNVDAFVRLIAADLSVTATREGDTIILSAVPPQ